jgi:uncharacterized membrane-anchored protein YhcB (DUF1043 family)
VALYIPASNRRRRTVLIGVAALVIGLVLGVVAGRSTAPTVADKISSVRSDARRTAANLRVIVLHDQEGIASETGGGGTDIQLENTRKELQAEFAAAAWLSQADKDALIASLAALTARADKSSAEFGTATEALAKQIEETFGVSGDAEN